ncbi:MAG TPA: hypothetical protein VFH95_16000 [Candidatus Kapabacteria bacterium]|nr:hypothetical protein [Candidatus Kapabacteria bacterium]
MNYLKIGHSPDPDDAFMFYGFAERLVTIPGYENALELLAIGNCLFLGNE